jgi:AraC-like DNA-binding protein
MNAKSFCRIARFHYLWSEFLAQGIVNTQEMIYNAGFYDQSHMINDFKQFIGESPKTFLPATRNWFGLCLVRMFEYAYL